MKNAFSIRGLVVRVFRPSTARGYEGAGGTTRWPDAPAAWPNNAAALAAAGPLRVRARHAAANNPLARRGVDTLKSSIVGTGIKPQGAFGPPFEQWTDHADADGLGDFYALTEGMVEAMIVDGEGLALMQADPDTGALVLRQIAADQLDASVTRELPGGGRIIAGVEFDAIGRRVAYWILPDPLDLPMVSSLTPVRIDAADVIHLFKTDFPGQVGGVSWLAPVLLMARELDRTMDANLSRLQVAALFAGFITDAGGGSAGFEEASADNLAGGLAPGILKVLRPGQGVEFPNMPSVGGDVISFMELQQRIIAAGLGVTAEQLTGDYSKTNYSASRASLIEFRRRIEAIQHNTVVFQFCRPVWRRWATLEILSGRLEAPGFTTDPEPYLTARWVTPGWAWVDPQKEVAANREAVDAGFASRRKSSPAAGSTSRSSTGSAQRTRPALARHSRHHNRRSRPPHPTRRTPLDDHDLQPPSGLPARFDGSQEPDLRGGRVDRRRHAAPGRPRRLPRAARPLGPGSRLARRHYRARRAPAGLAP